MMRSMGAAGMGVDSPSSDPPSQVPAIAAEDEEKRDYRADNEDEDDYDVDNSFDIPNSSGSGDAESTEDYDGDELRKDNEMQQETTNILPALPGILQHETMETLSSATDSVARETLNFEHHTVIRDTTVVKKFSRPIAEEDIGATESDSIFQENKIAAIAVTKSTAVIDRTTSSIVGSAVTDELGDGASSYISSEEHEESISEDSDMGNKAEGAPYLESLLDENDQGMNDDGQEEHSENLSTGEEEKHAVAETMEVQGGENLVNENLPSGSDADGEKIDTLDQHNEGVQKAQAPAEQTAASAKTPPKSLKRKQASQQPSVEVFEKVDDDGGHQSPAKTVASTPVHTPKRPKRGGAKTPRKAAPTITESASPSEKLPQRRSSRIKIEPPKFTYPVKLLSDDTVMTHFDRTPTNATSPATPNMVCKYCGTKVPTSRGVAARHLKACPAFERQEQVVSKVDHVDVNEETAALLSPATKNVKIEAASHRPTEASNKYMDAVLLMGSETLALKLKDAFQRTAFAGHGAISRFQDLIRDDVTGLRYLHVQSLLDAVDPRDGPVNQLHAKLPGFLRATSQDPLESVSKAKARDLEKYPLCFPAPRSIARRFIAPLAAELGLEYAMHRHTATLVSCPQEETVLDWRFHRTEMVVFQLRGKSVLKLKKSHVEHPLHCFHPESWFLNDTMHAAKAHRVATEDKGTLGFLAPPGDDMHVFDEDENGDAPSVEPKEHMMKPGSVAYVPAGVWFETETQDNHALWLEVQLASVTYDELVFSALKQLAWGDKQWRMGVQLYPGDRGHGKQTRHHITACIKSLRSEMNELEEGDLLPEYAVTEDLRELIAEGLIHETSKSPTSTSIEVDLTNPGFKLKHVKVFKDAAYRVNPVAVIMSTDEIPHLEVDDTQAAGHAAGSARTPRRALKKSPKPKPKRKQVLRVISHAGKHTYVLDEIFGNDKLCSQLHVTFQCSAEQSIMVEWLRGRGAEPFDLEEFSRCDSSLRQSKTPTRYEEKVRNLLRFLCFVGYVTQVKSPSA
ncbi:unnamed protein product [Phytophthora lilii]|uniref:Unnamed protein product n=1 Tax=Phytophthora lilii TaxID=2077276 RepID=A0A9W6WZU0_9STRA|nr:unnamed protein product [Phytophthora lilii]